MSVYQPRQTFAMTDVLRLEVETDPAAGFTNLCRNPDGELGTWGWRKSQNAATLATGPATVETRRNLGAQPLANWSIPDGGGVTTVATITDARWQGGSARRRDWSVGATSVYVQPMDAIPAANLTVGDRLLVSLRIDSAGHASTPDWRRAAIAGAPTVATAASGVIDHGDGTKTYWAVLAVTAVSTGALSPLLGGFGNMSAGGHIAAGDWLFERASVRRPWFNGSWSPDPDRTPAWLGAAGSSESVLRRHTAKPGLAFANPTGVNAEVGWMIPRGDARYVGIRLTYTGDAPAAVGVWEDKDRYWPGWSGGPATIVAAAGNTIWAVQSVGTARQWLNVWIRLAPGKSCVLTDVMISAAAANVFTPAAPWAYNDPWQWTNILGDSSQLAVNRGALEVSTLTAHIVNPGLDPAVNNALRRGRAVRCLATADAGATWTPLYTGTIDEARTDYVRDKTGRVRPRITLTARDNATQLAGFAAVPLTPWVTNPHPLGVYDQVAALRRELYFYSRVPWRIAGVTHLTNTEPAAIGSTTEGVLLDQVIATRNTAQALAWIDPRDRLIVTATPAAVAVPVFTSEYSSTDPEAAGEWSYTDIGVAYAPSNCVNAVTLDIVYPDAGGVARRTFGPVVDEESAAANGVYAATYTVNAAGYDEEWALAYAEQLLAANADPGRAISSITAAVLTPAHIGWAAGIDLCSVLDVTQTGLVADQCRVDTITHRITPRGWRVTYGFEPAGSVPAAIATTGGGVGPLAEVASNANGTARKYANGLMVCTHQLDLNAYNGIEHDWTFPAEFTEEPTLSAIARTTVPQNHAVAYATSPTPNTVGRLRLHRTTNTTTTWRLTAIGIWK